MAAVATVGGGTRLELEEIRHDESAIRRVIGWPPNVSRWHCPSPTHEDKHPSASLYQTANGIWRCRCFSCNMDGDVVEWQKIRAGQTFQEAKASLLGENPYTQQAQSPDEKPDRSTVKPGGAGFDSLKELSQAVAKAGTIGNVYRYTPENEDGLIIYRIKRESGKEFRQCRREGGRYYFGAPAKPHPLYRRDLVSTAETIIVPEGEKCCDAVNNLEIPGIAATTSPGGSGNAKSADWSPLAGKRLVLWPDNDKPGRKYISDVIDCLRALPNPPTEILEIHPGDLDLGDKEDAFDYLASGRTLQDALALAQPVPATVVVVEPEPLPAEPQWPEPIDPAAYYGLAGDFVRIVSPESESDPVALLAQFVTVAGNMMGRTVYWEVESTRHYGNLYLAIVGETSNARKGTGFDNVRRVVRLLSPSYDKENIKSGVSSGEGIKYNLRDSTACQNEKGESKGDPGISDKRLLNYEPEFALTLKVIERMGNTLSPVHRQLWDHGSVRSLTKNDPISVTDAHFSVVTHVTMIELVESLSGLDQVNGFANRFIWITAKRSQSLPFGGSLTDLKLAPIVERLREAVHFADCWNRNIPMGFDAAGARLWKSVYENLTRGIPGMVGAILARAAAIVRRLAMIYATLDLSESVTADHLQAALALWEYSEASVRFIFGDKTGLRIADEILAMLKRNESGLSRTEISNAFGRNVHGERIQECLDLLARDGRIVMEKRDTGGRPVEFWKYRNGGTK